MKRFYLSVALVIVGLLIVHVAFVARALFSERKALQVADDQLVAASSQNRDSGPKQWGRCGEGTYPSKVPDSKGLQCYFYGPIGAQRGVWIYPSTKNVSFEVLNRDLLKNFKTYTSEDKSFSFKYPAFLSIDSGQDVKVNYSDFTLVSVYRSDSKTDLQDWINQVTKGLSFEKYTRIISGQEVTVYSVAPQSNLDETHIYIVREYDTGYYFINMTLTGEPYEDFLAWSTVSQIKFAH